jgi:hypothetical protein
MKDLAKYEKAIGRDYLLKDNRTLMVHGMEEQEGEWYYGCTVHTFSTVEDMIVPVKKLKTLILGVL